MDLIRRSLPLRKLTTALAVNQPQLTRVRRALQARQWYRIQLLLGAVVVLVLGFGVGAVYGYFTSSGHGSGGATTGTLQNVTIATAGTPSSPLLPGGASGDLVFSVTNPNNATLSLIGIALSGGAISFDGGHAGCTTTDSNPVATLNVPSNLPISIPHNSGNPVQVDLHNAVSMDVAATSNCQGATINVPITITLHQG
jgi:hypothetical protein